MNPLDFWDEEAALLFAELWLGEPFNIAHLRVRHDSCVGRRMEKRLPIYVPDSARDKVLELIHWCSHWRRWKNKTNWSQVSADVQLRFVFQPSKIIWSGSHARAFKERLCVVRAAWVRFLERGEIGWCKNLHQATRFLAIQEKFKTGGVVLPFGNSDSRIGV